MKIECAAKERRLWSNGFDDLNLLILELFLGQGI